MGRVHAGDAHRHLPPRAARRRRRHRGGRPARPVLRGRPLVLLPRGDAHALRDAEGSVATPITALPAEIEPDGLRCVRGGGGGAPTELLCGTITLAPEAGGFLLDVLPPLLVASPGRAHAAWVMATLALIDVELSGGVPGGEVVGGRLAEVLFIQALRAWSAVEEPAGWLAALRDPQLARALGHIHREPARAWTSESLARRSGLSRTVFYERFVGQVGETPAGYLTRWRMHLARERLREGASLADVAERVGYGSEAAFARAFKRENGESPAAWRARIAS